MSCIKISGMKIMAGGSVAPRNSCRRSDPIKPGQYLKVTTTHGLNYCLRIDDLVSLSSAPDPAPGVLQILGQRAAGEINQSNERIKISIQLIKQSCPALASTIGRVYQLVLPYLITGRHGNPVHHTAWVLWSAAQIGIGEKLKTDDLAVLTAASLLHDAGFAFTPADKIRVSDIEALASDPVAQEELRAKAVFSRQAHMLKGAEIAWLLLNDLGTNGYKFSPVQIGQIINIVRNHDNPSIQELTGTPSGEWLFFPDQWLLALHREADRLWMVTSEGIQVDLDRDRAKGKPSTPGNKLEGNIKRHRDEGKLYQTAFSEAAEVFGLREGTFYRSGIGFDLFQKYIRESQEFFGIQ